MALLISKFAAGLRSASLMNTSSNLIASAAPRPAMQQPETYPAQGATRSTRQQRHPCGQPLSARLFFSPRKRNCQNHSGTRVQKTTAVRSDIGMNATAGKHQGQPVAPKNGARQMQSHVGARISWQHRACRDEPVKRRTKNAQRHRQLSVTVGDEPINTHRKLKS
jgi:hypothetical protein